MSKVSYFVDVEDEIKNSIIFNFKFQNFDKDTVIFKAGEIASAVFILSNGILEVIAKIDGEDIVIDRLSNGAIINYRAFLLGDTIDVSFKCCSSISLFYLENSLL